MVTRNSGLPEDFPEDSYRSWSPDQLQDGPFSVRMSGIDKTATDEAPTLGCDALLVAEDIEKYFEERRGLGSYVRPGPRGDVKVKSVEQFDVPRHTARIDFNDKARPT